MMKQITTGEKMMRECLAETLCGEVRKGLDVVALDADLLNSSGLKAFAQTYPDRFFNCGIQEANMVGVAGGLSMTGKIPVVHTFASFAARRCTDQVFMAGVYNRQNIKIIGSDPGILNCANGGTHYALEDVGIMRSMNGISVYDPSDVTMLEALLPQILREKGVSYIRLTRKTKQIIYPEGTGFTPGKAHVIRWGRDVNIIASGTLMVPEALKAAEMLGTLGIDAGVVDMFTISPVDSDAVREAAGRAPLLVTAENHNIHGGLFSAVSEVIATGNLDVRCIPVAFLENWGEAGSVDYMKKRSNLSAEAIVNLVQKNR